MPEQLQQRSKLLTVNDLSVQLNGISLLKNVTFEMDRGDVLSVIGPNGAGKTTLVKAMLGLTSYTGEVKIEGSPMHKKLNSIGYVPQKFDFDRSFPITVAEFLKLSIGGENLKNNKVCDQLKVDDLYDKILGKLSGGQLQRVMIVRAMIKKPKLLIFDEPTSGIDIGGQDSFYEIISHLNKDHGVSIIIISHEINVVFKYSNKVLCLNDGIVCCNGKNIDLDAETLKKMYGENMSIHNHKH